MASAQTGELVIRLDLGESGDTFEERVDPTQKLAYSRNMRPTTGLPKKAPRVLYAASDANANASLLTCHGFATLPDQDAAVAYMRPRDGQYRLGDDLGSQIRSTVLDAECQNGYFPLRVKTCETSQLGYMIGRCAVCVTIDGHIWTAAVKEVAAGFGVYVSVDDADGNRLVASALITTPAGTGLNYPWVELTSHGSSGVRLWVMDRTTRLITMRDLEVNSTYDMNSITVNSTTSIFTPLACEPAICSNDTEYAWLLTRSSAVAADCVLHKVDVATGARTGLNMAAVASAATVYLTLSQARFDSTGAGAVKRHVAFAISDTALNTTFGVVDGDTLVADWSTGGLYGFGRVAVAIRAVGNAADDKHAVLAVEPANGGMGSATPQRVVFDARRLGAGGASATRTVYWASIASHGASWNLDPGSTLVTYPEVYPIFSIRRNTSGTVQPYATDPALTMVCLQRYADATWGVAPIGRFAVDEANVLAGALYGVGQIAWEEKLMATVYAHTLPGNSNPDYVAKYVALDLNGSNVGITYFDGCGLLAAAQPVYWDGAETVELGYRHRPELVVGLTGSGAALTGTWRFRAVYRYTDARGNVRRSAPSEAYEITPAAASLLAQVAVPHTLRDGVRQDDVSVELYLTYWNGTVASSDYYFFAAVSARGATNGMVQFDGITNAVTTNMILYSIGTSIDELYPEAPPALWDVATVGDRVWAIEAENRSAARYSKRKDVGYVGFGVEFNGLQRSVFPSSAGKLMAVRDGGGYPLFLCQRGVYAVSGDGPESNLTGTLFSPPRQVSKIGCASRESVLSTTFGVFFCTAEGRAAVISGGQVKVFDEIDLSGCIGSFCFETESEAIFALGTEGSESFGASRLIAYNWRRNTWNTWYVMPGAMHAVSFQPSTTDGLFFSSQQTVAFPLKFVGRITNNFYAPSSTFLAVDPTVGQMVLRSPWVMPNADNGDLAFQEVILRAKYEAAHSVTIKVEFDYDSSLFIERTWSSAELTALKSSDNLYTVCVRLGQHAARSIRVTITESLATTLAFRPISLTLPYGVSPGSQRRALKQGATK